MLHLFEERRLLMLSRGQRSFFLATSYPNQDFLEHGKSAAAMLELA